MGILGDLFSRRKPGSGEIGMLGDPALFPRRRLFEGEIASQEFSVSLRAGLRLWFRAACTDCGETGRIASEGLRVDSVTLEEKVGVGEERRSRVSLSFGPRVTGSPSISKMNPDPGSSEVVVPRLDEFICSAAVP
jgi:hypothetical protein